MEIAQRGKCLLVASTGGHLAQIDIIGKMHNLSRDSLWVTFDNAQSRSLLLGRRHQYLPYIGPRQYLRALAAFPALVRLCRSEPWDAVISTGAAVAVPAMLAARLSRRRAIYVESVSRLRGPSLSGRVIRWIPGIVRLTQHKAWAGPAWKHQFSVFDAFDKRGLPTRSGIADRAHRPLKIFVTLGTIRPYRFDALVDSVLKAVAGQDVELLWQLGSTTRAALPGTVQLDMTQASFGAAAEWADVVITHAGVATCLSLVADGRRAIVVPRRSKRGEHVDEHQEQIAEELAERGLVTSVEATELDWAHLLGNQSKY